MREPDDGLPLPRAASIPALLAVIPEALARGQSAVLATVIARRGSTPATPGQKLLLLDDRSAVGTIGGGALERRVLAAMSDRLRELNPLPTALSLSLGAELGMCCGGTVDLMLEVFVPAPAVGIVGAGHVASALAPALAHAGFSVTVADAREPWADPARMPGISVVCGDHDALGALVPRVGAILVMTHDHQLDQAAIEWALRERYAFVGGIGSRAKALRTRARLDARGFTLEDQRRVRMPVGLAIGARSPEEIAVSITAEMIAWKRRFTLPERAALACPEPVGSERE